MSHYIVLLYIPVWIDLKVATDLYSIVDRLLYIPVWIDLKRHRREVRPNRQVPLHSSMDRFKEDELQICYVTFVLYIPVWIDLKSSENISVAELLELYIPVWIDLKINNIIIVCYIDELYIPVWIDLKVRIAETAYAFTNFTFQYG